MDKWGYSMYYLSLFAIGIALFLVVSFFFVILYPFKTIEMKRIPLPVLTKEVSRGSELIFVVDYCKYTDQPLSVSNVFIGQKIIPTNSFVSFGPKGCYDNILIILRVPEHIPTGRYHIQTVLGTEINFLRYVIERYDTEEFEVIE